MFHLNGGKEYGKTKPQKNKRRKKVLRIVLIVLLILVLAIVGAVAKLYFDVSGSVDRTYESVDRDNGRDVNFSDEEPFSVLLLGIDTGDLGRTEQGRSDTMMVATVDPQENKSTLVSIPRDTYVDIVSMIPKIKSTMLMLLVEHPCRWILSVSS